LLRQRIRIGGFTASRSTFYTAFENKMKLRGKPRVSCLYTVTIFSLFALGQLPALAQEAPQKRTEKPAAKSSEKTGSPEKAENPAQIELLETKVRFETNGDSRKEVHALVKINSELGVRQFARLNFDFNRSFESVEIPVVHITHTSGGTADILPGAIADQPNPAVINAPAYQDVRVKSVRILGLQPGDTLEYRVIRTVSHHPLAPDFWLDHTFDRTGVVSQEIFKLDLPASRTVQMKVSKDLPEAQKQEEGTGASARLLFKWNLAGRTGVPGESEAQKNELHVTITTYGSWEELANRLGAALEPGGEVVKEFYPKAKELIQGKENADEWINSFYDFVSQKIKTVDLPLGATEYKTRKPSDTLSSGYATAEDKFVLFAAIGNNYCGPARAGLVISNPANPEYDLPQPSAFDHLLTMSGYPSINVWMDLNLEVAPYRMILPQFRKKRTLLVGPAVPDLWPIVAGELPFSARQTVNVDASLAADGKLAARVHYSLRGDNELLLRVAFHHMPKEKWKELAQLLSLTDGFRGQVTSVNASNPYATKEPFIVEYEITQLKFVDWSKKTVRIPALLPQLGLPDAPAKPAAGAATTPIELGTPLEVETQMTLHLPAGTTAQTPTGTSVDRDYATYASQYSAKGTTLTGSRHIRFLLRQIPGARAADYNAFLRAVQSDEAQDFTLESPAVPSPKPATPGDPFPPGRQP
jgi:hypothetical protein